MLIVLMLGDVMLSVMKISAVEPCLKNQFSAPEFYGVVLCG
jgi:hypothetical protein